MSKEHPEKEAHKSSYQKAWAALRMISGFASGAEAIS
jgi:hypothetical protein